MGLEPRQLEDSREVLSDYGNMSSVSVLFVLQRMLQEAAGGRRSVCAMAFGPGLVVETALLELQPACGRETGGQAPACAQGLPAPAAD